MDVDSQSAIIYVGIFSAGFLLSAIISLLWARAAIQKAYQSGKIRIVELETLLSEKNHRLDILDRDFSSIQKENETLKTELARVNQIQLSQKEKLQWLESARTELREMFDSLAVQSLRSNSEYFFKQAGALFNQMVEQVRGDWKNQQTEFKNLMHPIKDDLTKLDGHVRHLEQKREGAYQGIREQLTRLSVTHSELQKTTLTLSQALKSPTVRGRWGEIQLRRVVEMAGMIKHVDFLEQAVTDQGRPDMIVRLPRHGVIPIDSKTPLAAYLDAMASRDEKTRKAKLADHVKALKSRIRELSRKTYWKQFEEAPDFVVMFIPNEACLNAAFDLEPQLIEYAVDNHVLITTPVTLIALLKTVAYNWQQQQMTENARYIAEQGQELHKRLENFVRHLADLGQHLNAAVSGYNRSIGSLEQRFYPIMRRFRDLGICAGEIDLPEKIETPIKSVAGNKDE